MTTPSPCQTLAAYLDGRLSDADADAFEAHLADCETCAEDADDLSLALALLADEPCPPEVLDRALAQARRRAPDREARPSARRRSAPWRLAVLPLLALAVAAAVWLVRPSEAPAPRELAASVDEPPAAEPAAEPTAEPEAPETPPAVQPGPIPPAAPDASPAPRAPARVAPAPRRAPAPAPAAVPEPDIAQAVPPDSVPADSVAAAKEELLYAFALVADAQDHAADAVADGVGRVSDAIRSTPPLASPR